MDSPNPDDETLASILARLGATLEGIPLLTALIEATGLGLREVMHVVHTSKTGGSFAHITATRLAVIKAARAESTVGDEFMWRDRFVEAALDDRPWLTGVPGPANGLYCWRREQPPPSAEWWIQQIAFSTTPEQREALRQRLVAEPSLNDESPAWFGGDASFDACRATLRTLVAGSPFWAAHIQIVRDKATAVTCRFTLD